MKLITAKRLNGIRTFGGKLLAYAGLRVFGQRHFAGLRRRLKTKEEELREEQRERQYRQAFLESGFEETRGLATPGGTTPTLLLLNDCRDQDNYGAQILVDGLLEVLSQSIPSYRLRTIPSHWVIDTTYGFGAFVNGANLHQPKALWPEVADQFEVIAEEWLSDRGGPGAREFLKRLRGSDVVVLNGEGSIYRRNLSAIRELFVAWFAKTQLGIPTLFLNGMVHLTEVVPILPAMVRKTFAVLDGVAVREPCSLRNLKEYVPDLDARMIPDSAFFFARETSDQELRANPLEEQLAGVEYFTFDPGAMPADHRFGKRSALFHLIAKLKTVVPQAVLISSAPADSYIEDLAHETGSIFVRTMPDYRALMGLVSDARFMVTGRYHNPIFGALVGCPSITLASTSHKVHGVCELLEGQIGMPYDGTDLESNIEAITARAAHYVANRSSLRPRLIATAARLGEATLEMGEMVKAALADPSSGGISKTNGPATVDVKEEGVPAWRR